MSMWSGHPGHQLLCRQELRQGLRQGPAQAILRKHCHSPLSSFRIWTYHEDRTLILSGPYAMECLPHPRKDVCLSVSARLPFVLQVEREVQNLYAHDLSRRCEVEKTERSRLVSQAKRSFSREERDRKMKEAQAMSLKACNELNTLFYG